MQSSSARAAAPVDDISAISAAPLRIPTRDVNLASQEDGGSSGAAQTSTDSPGRGSDARRLHQDVFELPRPRRTRSDSDLAKIVLSPAAEYAGRVQVGARVYSGEGEPAERSHSAEERTAGKADRSALAENLPPCGPAENGLLIPYPATRDADCLLVQHHALGEDGTPQKEVPEEGKIPMGADLPSRLDYLLEKTPSGDDACSDKTDFDGAVDPEDSPYPEVRASVSNEDSSETVVLTFRVCVLGSAFCAIVSAVNCYFSLRYPAPLITPTVTQLVACPLGIALAKYLPNLAVTPPRWTRRLGVPEKLGINPGPFTRKELTVLTILANVSTAPAYALTYSLTVEKRYGRHMSAGADLLLVLSSQVIGFGVAGLSRRFLVWPASMIWPQNLVFSTVVNTLVGSAEQKHDVNSRFRYFAYVVAFAFCWFWLPGYLFTALSAFSWVCWIAPENAVVNQLFGVSSGLGMGILTFDWSQMGYVVAPLVMPWSAQVNIFCGFVLLFWIIVPSLYYSNTGYSAFLPISASAVFDRFGQPYNTTRIIDSSSLKLNTTAYKEYSPLFLTAAFTVATGVHFMLASALVMDTLLKHGTMMLKQLRASRYVAACEDDVHGRMMRNYRDVPNWWFGALFLAAIASSMIFVTCYNTEMPPWCLLVGIAFALLYFLPSGIIFATTSMSVTLNVVIELIAGYLLPGLPLPNMLFKLYTVQVSGLGLYYAQDMKLGHYQKVPPRITFMAQLLGTVLTAFVQVGVKRWLVANVPDLCERGQAAQLTCPNVQVFYMASTIWGVVGPARLFGTSSPLHSVYYWTAAGAILPLVVWLLARRFSNTWLAHVEVSVALLGLLFLPPGTGINLSAPIIVGFAFQYYLRNYKYRWWARYNYLTSAGLDAGTAISGIVIFLAVQLPKSGITLDWWGNNVYTKTADWLGTPYKTPPPEGFGPTSW